MSLREELERLADAFDCQDGNEYTFAIAAANLALEAAARCCDAEDPIPAHPEVTNSDEANTARRCAAAIRAMRVE